MIREALASEIHLFLEIPEGVECVAWAVVVEDGAIVGHGCCSRLPGGLVWAHDLGYWGADPWAAVRLIRFVLRLAAARGVRVIHTDTSNPRMPAVFLRMGWKRAPDLECALDGKLPAGAVVLRGELS